MLIVVLAACALKNQEIGGQFEYVGPLTSALPLAIR
jgi:hypothetical protein